MCRPYEHKIWWCALISPLTNVKSWDSFDFLHSASHKIFHNRYMMKTIVFVLTRLTSLRIFTYPMIMNFFTNFATICVGAMLRRRRSCRNKHLRQVRLNACRSCHSWSFGTITYMKTKVRTDLKMNDFLVHKGLCHNCNIL
jgi:hypothetical protein